MIVILMGVSGSGKTTIGKLMAERTGWIFADADDYFTQPYKDKMAAGHPLNDNDRAPWLLTLNRLLRSWDEKNTNGILACSALKEKYHEVLEAGISSSHVMFIFLDADKELIAARLAARKHEYMNPKLLDSQLATLEYPDDAFRVVDDRPPSQVVDEILARISIQQQLGAIQVS